MIAGELQSLIDNHW